MKAISGWLKRLDGNLIAHTKRPCLSCGHNGYKAINYAMVSCRYCGAMYDVEVFKQNPVATVEMVYETDD